VRFLLLTARPDLEVVRRLAAAAEDLGVDAVTVDATRVSAAVGGEPALWYGDDNLIDPPPRVALARVGNWRPASILAALEVAESAGVAPVNAATAIRTARDHWSTILTLAARGLPVPATVAGADPEELAAKAVDRLGFPVVVKQRRSRMGIGVIRCDSRDHLEAVLDSLWRLGDEFVVQSFLASDGCTLRLLVVGDEVVAAARLTARTGEWRSNAARGGTLVRHAASEAERELAVAGAQALGLGVCGVDLLPGESTSICEVNPTPGFLRLEAATGVDVAHAIVQHIVHDPG
jgi:ribosomal protein S6--L-glutamate ligase